MNIWRPSMKRRDLLKIGAASPLLMTALSLPARALNSGVANAGFYKFMLGDFKLTVVSDGYMALPANMLGNNADPNEVAEFLNNFHLDPTVNYSHLNHIVIETGDAVILIDAGDGGRFMPETSGHMMDNLSQAGIDPESITHVVITHAHPDHIWGVRDDFDEPFLPNATYLMGDTETAYWLTDDLVEKVNPENQTFVLGAVNSINTIKNTLERVNGEYQVATGVTMIDTPGHTPGHMSITVESAGQKLLITGDAFSHAWMNFVHPEWTQAADIDGELTVATRKKLLEMALSENMMIAGYHFPFPGLGYVGHFGDRYEFVPAVWRWS